MTSKHICISILVVDIKSNYNSITLIPKQVILLQIVL